MTGIADRVLHARVRARPHARRRLAFLLATLAALALIAVVAELDHAHKQAMGNAAQESEWFCEHRGVRCGGPDSGRIQHRWEAREVGYKTAFGLVAVTGVVLLVSRRRPRR